MKSGKVNMLIKTCLCSASTHMGCVVSVLAKTLTIYCVFMILQLIGGQKCINNLIFSKLLSSEFLESLDL